MFDVYCQLADGSRIIVEMQKAEQEYFKDRSIYYSTYPIREQAPQGKWNYRLKDVYTVGILNFVFPDDEYSGDDLVHEIKLKDVEDNHGGPPPMLSTSWAPFYDKLTFVYLDYILKRLSPTLSSQRQHKTFINQILLVSRPIRREPAARL